MCMHLVYVFWKNALAISVLPLAAVVIAGLITSTALTLLVLPVLYRWFEDKEAEA